MVDNLSLSPLSSSLSLSLSLSSSLSLSLSLSPLSLSLSARSHKVSQCGIRLAISMYGQVFTTQSLRSTSKQLLHCNVVLCDSINSAKGLATANGGIIACVNAESVWWLHSSLRYKPHCPPQPPWISVLGCRSLGKRLALNKSEEMKTAGDFAGSHSKPFCQPRLARAPNGFSRLTCCVFLRPLSCLCAWRGAGVGGGGLDGCGA